MVCLLFAVLDDHLTVLDLKVQQAPPTQVFESARQSERGGQRLTPKFPKISWLEFQL